MKVILIGNYVRDAQESMQRFSRILSDGLRARSVDVSIIQPRAILGRWGNPHGGFGKWCGYVDKYLFFSLQLTRLASQLRRGQSEPTVVHICDQANALYTRALKGVPHLVTCCDLMAIRAARGEIQGQETKWFGRQLQRAILSALKRAGRVTCISAATRRDLLRLARSRGELVDVTPMGLNYPYSPMELGNARATVHELVRQQHGKEAPFRPYILHVGGNQWYKNRLGVMRIYNRMLPFLPYPPRLIMAGKPFTPEMKAYVSDTGLEDEIISIEACDSEQLRALYSAAELLLFPSILEGFGWPIIEAQACGCRVVTTQRAPMTEVGGDAALYVDAMTETNVARQTALLLNQSPAAREELQRRGLLNAARFSTQAMIDKYLAIYTELLSANVPFQDANPTRSAVG